MAAFNADEAATAFMEASRWQDALVRRTEGLSWLVWAAIGPGILVSLAYAGTLGLPWWGMFAAWLPWVLLGATSTHLLWRSAALTWPQVARPTWAGYATKAAVMAAMLGALWVLHPKGMAPMLALVATGWVALGLFRRRLSSLGRRACYVGGAMLAVGAAAVGLLPLTMGVQTVASVALLGAIPAAVGLWQTTSG